MDTFFNTIRKTLIATMFVIFGLVATYVPQNWNDNQNIETVHAGRATTGLQIAGKIEQSAINIATTATKAITATIQYLTENLWVKDYQLDPIAWGLAKAAASHMTNSLVNWIGSGFGGSPAFVQDLQRFLTEAADNAVDDYLANEIIGPDSFICEEFQIDVRVAVAQEYNLDRIDQEAPACKPGDLVGDLDTFTSGAQGSFSEGGWNDWLTIVTNSDVYTPYGAYTVAKSRVDSIVENTKAEEEAFISYGDGFLSQKICHAVEGAAPDTFDCEISSPGKIIQEALSFNLDSGRQSLIEADEINEIIGGLLSSITNRVFTGSSGFLPEGVNGSAGYEGFDPTDYFPEENSTTIPEDSGLVTEDDFLSLRPIKESLESTQFLGDRALYYRTRLQTFSYTNYRSGFLNNTNNYNTLNGVSTLRSNPLSSGAFDRLLIDTVRELNAVISKTDSDEVILNNLINEFELNTTSRERKSAIVSSFEQLDPYSISDANTYLAKWTGIVDQLDQ